MIAYRSGNPALSSKTFKNVTSRHANDVMTLEGTVNKTALSLLILLVSAFYTFDKGDTNFIWIGFIAGFILALTTELINAFIFPCLF